MKNFYKTVLRTTISKELSEVYKKVSEIENDRKWVENSITADGEATIEIKPV